MRAMLCPCCAAHLRVGETVSMVCNNCNSHLVFISEGGVSELRPLPPQFVVPYSDSRWHSVRINPGDIHSYAWADVARTLEAELKFRQAGCWAFGCASAALVFGSLVSALVLMAAGRDGIEGPAACFVMCLFGAPAFGFVAAHFHEKAKLTEEGLGNVFRNMLGPPRHTSRRG